MKELIEALQIFLKYDNPDYPTHCEHDELFVMINPDSVLEADKDKLRELGFIPHTDYSCFVSYKYGLA